MRTGDFLAGLLVGALVGASLGLLFAPETGEETRERVKEGALKLKESAAERGRELAQRCKGEDEEDEE